MTRSIRARRTAVLAMVVAVASITGGLASTQANAGDGRTRTNADHMLLAPRWPARTALRSGTIIDGVFTTSPAWTCESQPDCGAWLLAGCDGRMTGRDPAWHASIEDVADLADDTTLRVFEVRRGSPESVIIGGVVLQFFRSDCTEVHAARWQSWKDCSWPSCQEATRWHGLFGRFGREWVRKTLRIPRDAAWMTVSANDNLNITWTLSGRPR